MDRSEGVPGGNPDRGPTVHAALVSYFLSWIFNNTRGSLLLVCFQHGSEIWVAYWMMSTGINPSNLDNYWGYGAILVLLATIIVIVTGPQNLSRKHARIVHKPAH